MAKRAKPPVIHDLAIVGAGPAGASLALACQQAGLDVALIDARDPDIAPPPDTRTFAIVRGSWHLLRSIGVAGALEAGAEPLNGLEATDGARHWFGAPTVGFGNEDLPEDPDVPPLGYMVAAAELQAALDAALKAGKGLTHLAPARFAGLEVHPGYAIARLEGDGDDIRARLIVGCDGLNSPVRQAAGIGVEGRSYGKSVFAADVALSRPHHGIARQLFTPEGPFATLPMSGQRANLAWYMKEGAAEALAERSPAEIEAELNARFAHFAGEMKLDGPAIAYKLVLQMATAMTAPRVALVGDAAHRINPLAGQGLNLGFRDVAALAEVAHDQVHMGLDPGAATALETYARWRRFDSALTAYGMDAIDRIYSNDVAALKPLRGLALAIADRAEPVRRAMARQASAAGRGLPKLMRGEALV